MPWVDPVKTWTLGDRLVESLMNQEFRDRFEFLKNNADTLGGFFGGVQLGTHIDTDLAATTVQLRRADRVVFDDGSSARNLSPLTADITLSGPGGLDTGSEAASTWYEVHAIHKSSDGTTGLMLHRAKDYFLDESYDSPDIGIEIRKSTGTRTALGQGIKVDNAGYVDFVDIRLIRVGTPTGTLTLYAQIQTDAGGKPSGAILATSDKLKATHVSATGAQWVRFVFRTPVSLTAGTQYHLVLTGDWTASDANYVAWYCDTSSATYANGSRAQLEAGVWNTTGTTTHDFSFKVYVRMHDTAVTMPSGYDGKCLLGYVYNNGSSNLEPFMAVNRTVVPTDGQNQVITMGSTTIPTLTSVAHVIPPVPVRHRVRYGAVGGAVFFSIMPVPLGFRTPSVNRDGGGSSGDDMVVLEILTETQALYAVDTSADLLHDSYEW